MLGLQVIVAIGVAILIGSLIARRGRVTLPVVLVALGVALAAIPALRRVGLPSEAVLLLFLPALLFWESLTTSSREIRRNLRGVILSGTMFVAVTAAAVAVVGHACGLDWATSWFIGAAIAPTDATAVSSIGSMLGRRAITVLRAESLINDGTALVIFALVIEYATGSAAITLPHVTWLAFRSFFGGIAVGAVIGVVAFALRRRVQEPMLDNVTLILTPFVAYLVAEEIGASGVLAVVSCGLLFAQLAPRIVSAHSRQQSVAFWSESTYLLNAALFVLIGMELPGAIGGLTGPSVARGVAVMFAVYATMLVARFAALHASIYLIRLVDRRPSQRLRRTTFRGRLVSTFAGFRGAVSLAVALAVPAAAVDGNGRDMVVFVVAGVVVLSLVIQGAALPALVRWADIGQDTSFDDELDLAQRTASESALESLDEIGATIGVDDEVIEDVREEMDARLRLWTAVTGGDDDEEDDTVRRARQYRDLKLAIIAHKRSTIVDLRDRRIIDDTVLRQVQAHLDIEEIRLRGPASE